MFYPFLSYFPKFTKPGLNWRWKNTYALFRITVQCGRQTIFYKISCPLWGASPPPPHPDTWHPNIMDPFTQKRIGQGFRFQPGKGSVWIVTCFSMMGKASPDNKSCILLGLLSVDFFSGVAWLTESSSMVGRPSEDQPCALNRKWK